MANVTSCGDQTYFGNATPTVGWGTINIPSTITCNNSGTITVSGTSINLGNGVTSVASGSVLTINSGTSVWTTNPNKDISDFCELVLLALGYDTKYDNFCKMSLDEKKSLIRDIKIKRLLD